MSYIKVKNPESVDVKTNYLGTWYELPAGEENSFEEDVARRLVEVYGFLKLAGEAKPRDIPEVKEGKEESEPEEEMELPVMETVKEKIAKVIKKK